VERKVPKRKEKTKTGWGNAGSEAPSLYLPPYFDAYRKPNRKENNDGKMHPKDPQSQGAPTKPADLERARGRAKPRLSPNPKLTKISTSDLDNTARGADKDTQAFKRQYRPEGPRERLAFAWQMSGSPPSTLPRPDSIVFFFVEHGSLSPCGGASWGCLHSDANSPRGQMRR